MCDITHRLRHTLFVFYVMIADMDFDNDVLFGEISALLAAGKEVTVTVKGRSMMPFLVGGRDRVTLRRCRPEDIRRGCVVLARTGGDGRVVLHRVVRRTGDRLVLQGDGNRVQTETADVADVAGMASSFVRHGRVCSVRGLPWRAYTVFMLAFMSFRRSLIKLRISGGYIRQASAGYRGGIILSCLAGIMSVMLSLSFIYCSKHVIDVATGTAAGGIASGLIILAAIIVLQLLCGAAVTWIGVRLQTGLGNSLRRNVFLHIISSRWTELERFHTGDIVNRVERDTAAVVALLSGSLPAFVVSFVQLVVALVFFCLLDPWLPWLVVAVFPLLLLAGRVYTRKMYRYTRQIRESDSLIQSAIQESLQQRVIVKALGQTAGRMDVLDSRQSALRSQLMGRTRFSILSRSFVSAAFATGYMAVFAWGVMLLGSGAITFGTMAAFLQLVGKVQYPILDMARIVPSLVEVLASVDRLAELGQMSPEDESRRELMPSVPAVVLDDVTFTYAAGEAPVFSRFSYTFPAGSCTAVTGVTGRGKTTLIRLLLAFVSPDEGSVSLVCGDVRRDVSPQTRCNFTYVPQGNTLFSGTIRDNLLMASATATDDDMRRALAVAEAGFVWSLPDGLDTRLGEQGGRLSEGQAQRIAVARALLRQSHVLLLDEVTSALDAATASRLIANLRRECRGNTVIIITHHEAVAASCDAVLRL